MESSIHMSNVLPLNPKTSKGTRVRFTTDSKGIKKRVAVDGSEIGILRKV
jgi:ribosomal protein L24